MSIAETDRLSALRKTGVLDTLPEEGFDRLTSLAAALFDAPIALVSLIDEDRQWFKSRVGLDATETPRAWAFCDHAIRQGPHSVFVVEDATTDARFAHNPLVTGDPNVRFYAGATLTTAAGHNLGTLCVIDNTPRSTPSSGDMDRLKILARMVVDELELGQARKAVAEQRRLLQLAEAMSGVGHWRYNVADGQISWSDEVYRIHGVDRATFDPNLDKGVAFYHPDDQAAVADFVARGVSHGEDFAFQLRLERADGELRNVTCKATCEIDVAGATTAMFGVFQDVTDQVRTLKSVERSEARYRLLADNASDMISQFKPGGGITFVSTGARSVLGYSPEQMIGRKAMDMIHPDDVEIVRAYYKALRKTSGSLPDPLQFRGRHSDGHWVWLEGHPKMFFDPQTGEALETQDAVRDITMRKALESELRHARAEAEAAAAVKSEFLANMSHELRTPLTSILGFSKLLCEQIPLDAEGRRYVQRVSDASQALLTTVNDILDFSKLEAGQVEIAARAVDPAVIVKGALELLAPQANAKGLYQRLECEALPDLVVTDDARIRQILLNLISNAVKFTAVGGVTVSVRYDDATERLRCEVADTGAGIPADRLDRLFKRFSQVDATTTRSHGGTGLGLAICKGLAEAMGGTVGANSTLGQGSQFWVDLPCARVGTEPLSSPAAAAVVASSALSGLRMLIADDNAINRELVRIILSPYGVALAEAANGKEAIDLAQAAPYDVILMDVRMPDMDGPAAAVAIRQGDGPNTNAPIIAFTAEAADRKLPEAWVSIFDDQLPKPIIAADLINMLSAWNPAGAAADSPKQRRLG